MVAFLLGADTVDGIVLLIVAGIMLASATAALCPTHIALGISTHSSEVHRVGHHIRRRRS